MFVRDQTELANVAKVAMQLAPDAGDVLVFSELVVYPLTLFVINIRNISTAFFDEVSFGVVDFDSLVVLKARIDLSH